MDVTYGFRTLGLLVVAASMTTFAAAQEEIITLQNGSVFQGRLAVETERYLDLEVTQGRIILWKRWIATRRSTLATTVHGDSEAPVEVDTAALERIAHGRPTLSPNLLGGLVVVRPIGRSLKAFGKETPAVDVALGFCNLVRDGRGAEALEQLGDAEAIFRNAFPIPSRGMTAYSRRFCGRLLGRAFSRAITDASVAALLTDAKFTAREMVSPPELSLVEVMVHSGKPDPVRLVVGVSEGRIVDLSESFPAATKIVQDIRKALRELGNKSWQLVPLLEAHLGRGRAFVPVGAEGSDGDNPRKVWSLRPHERGYVVTLPWAYEPTYEEVPGGVELDFVVHAFESPSIVTVHSEERSVPLEELKRLVLENFATHAADIVVRAESAIRLDSVPALRLLVEATVGETRLSYVMVLTVTQGNCYQIVGLCESARLPDCEGVFATIHESLAFGL